MAKCINCGFDEALVQQDGLCLDCADERYRRLDKRRKEIGIIK